MTTTPCKQQPTTEAFVHLPINCGGLERDLYVLHIAYIKHKHTYILLFKKILKGRIPTLASTLSTTKRIWKVKTLTVGRLLLASVCTYYNIVEQNERVLRKGVT